ncbi:MAG: SDR family NAD(P)-dependent oxidoreductase [Thermoplasmatota archaeon]
MPLLWGKVAVVTGGTSGVGKAIAAGLAEEGAVVLLVGRTEERSYAARRDILAMHPGARVEVVQGDLSSQSSVRSAAQDVLSRHPTLHLVVHSTAEYLPRREVTRDGVDRMFASNYLGQFQMTTLLREGLERGSPSRVILVASKVGSTTIDFDDLQLRNRRFSAMRMLPRTKLAQIMFAIEYTKRMERCGVVAHAVHPGVIRGTGLFRSSPALGVIPNLVGASVERGADTALWLAVAPEGGIGPGGLWANRTRVNLHGPAVRDEARERLWRESESLLARAVSRKAAARPS